MKKTNDHHGLTLYDVAVGPTFLIFLGIPIAIVIVVIVIVILAIRMVKKAKAKALAGRMGQDGASNQERPEK